MAKLLADTLWGSPACCVATWLKCEILERTSAAIEMSESRRGSECLGPFSLRQVGMEEDGGIRIWFNRSGESCCRGAGGNKTGLDSGSSSIFTIESMVSPLVLLHRMINWVFVVIASVASVVVSQCRGHCLLHNTLDLNWSRPQKLEMREFKRRPSFTLPLELTDSRAVVKVHGRTSLALLSSILIS